MNDYDDYIEYLKAIFVFIAALACSWVLAWLCNFIRWTASLTIGNLLISLLFSDARGPYPFIFSCMSMIPYGFIPLMTICLAGFCKRRGILLSLYVIIAITLIFVYDANAKNILPAFLYDPICFLQKDCYFRFIGGVSVGKFTWSEDLSSLDYAIFDIMTIIVVILYSILHRDILDEKTKSTKKEYDYTDLLMGLNKKDSFRKK